MIQRDSCTTSVWQNIPKPDSDTQRTKAVQYDVAIVGAGITGLTLGLLLQQQGKNCIILEANTIGFGTSSGTTAHINTVLDTPYTDIIKNFGEEQAKLVASGAAEAIDLIQSNIQSNDIDCDFEIKNGWLLAENKDEEEALDKLYDAITKVGIEVSYSSEYPIPLNCNKAIVFSGQAQFHPTKYMMGLVKAFRLAGGRIIEQSTVKAVARNESLLELRTGADSYFAGDVVYATHIPPNLNLLHLRCAPYRSYVIAAKLENENAYPDALVYDAKDPYHYFRTAVIEGRKLLLIGGCDHKTGHDHNRERIFTELENYARGIFGIEDIPFKWSAQYYEPADGLPYIGQLPGADDHIYVATGYSGNGMTFGTLAARIIADLITSGESKYKNLFAPSRIKPVAGFKNFVKENVDVVKHFIADRIASRELEVFSEMSKGEGRVVKYQERQIALYKTEEGILKALHPVCPHAGCIVQWNGVEKSWDCPCHGARYDIDGKLLNGPATDNLGQVLLD